MKQTSVDFKGGRDSSTIIVGVFNTTISIMDRISRQKEIQDLNNYTSLLDMYRTLHPTKVEYTFFWSAHATLQDIL